MLVLPKRNIETWFQWLDSDKTGKLDIDENKDYKLSYKNAKAKSYGKNFGIWTGKRETAGSIVRNQPHR